MILYALATLSFVALCMSVLAYKEAVKKRAKKVADKR